MNLTKSIEYFNPASIGSKKCHIIGCGSIGSTVAENLARLGVTDMVLYDFDIVQPHNLANQMFVHSDIKSSKVEATKRIICQINPDAASRVQLEPQGYIDQRLNGYVFLAVDSIELRRKICEKNKMNRAIKAVFDFRTRLEDAQHYAANWGDIKQVENMIRTMNFTDDEARSATPISACGTELGVAPTVRAICAFGVANFMNFVRRGELQNIVVCDPFAMSAEIF